MSTISPTLYNHPSTGFVVEEIIDDLPPHLQQPPPPPPPPPPPTMAQPPPSDPPLFGLIPTGQPMLLTPTERPSPTSFLYALAPTTTAGAKPFSHITVLLLPGVVLPPGTAAAIYLVTPGAPGAAAAGGPNLKFLGGIGEGKESAVFKLSPTSTNGAPVVIGISVEPAEQVGAKMAELSSAGALVPAAAGGNAAAAAALGSANTLVLAQRIIRNAFNFLTSFSGSAGPAGGGGGIEVVPLKAFEEWWRKFEARIKSDPSFLERDD